MSESMNKKILFQVHVLSEIGLQIEIANFFKVWTNTE